MVMAKKPLLTAFGFLLLVVAAQASDPRALAQQAPTDKGSNVDSYRNQYEPFAGGAWEKGSEKYSANADTAYEAKNRLAYDKNPTGAEGQAGYNPKSALENLNASDQHAKQEDGNAKVDADSKADSSSSQGSGSGQGSSGDYQQYMKQYAGQYT